MYKYLLLNLVFSLVLIFCIAVVKPKIFRKRLLLVLAGMLLATAIFDSLIIGFDIVRYNREFISGLTIIKAPIEDFFYTVVAVLLTITLWERSSHE